jgi:hypothetical protein
MENLQIETLKCTTINTTIATLRCLANPQGRWQDLYSENPLSAPLYIPFSDEGMHVALEKAFQVIRRVAQTRNINLIKERGMKI